MIPRPNKPLTNTQRILILQARTTALSGYLADLEKIHFNTTARSEMRGYMNNYVQAIDGSFQDVYDDYLLYLWDELNAPVTPPGGVGERGVPIGLMNLGITYA